MRTEEGSQEKSRFSLSALLSMCLVSFTIELDNEFENRVPHRTSLTKPVTKTRDRPWLTSYPMYAHFLRFVDDEPLSVKELIQRTGLSAKEVVQWLTRLHKWWNYLEVERGSERNYDRMVSRSPFAATAWEVWAELPREIESRWDERFGPEPMKKLRLALEEVVDNIPNELPEYLPILGYGLRTGEFDTKKSRKAPVARTLSLPTLLSQVLLSLTLHFEAKSKLSLALCSNAIRLIPEEGLFAADLPRLAGVSKEAVKMMVGFMERIDLAVIRPDPEGSRSKLIFLTETGLKAQNSYRNRLVVAEREWLDIYEADRSQRLREALVAFVGDGSPKHSRLYDGIKPYPEGWRATVRPPQTLPDYPMVLHRGGYPDGS